MEALLSPEGCPWDRQQDHKTLKPYVIEEAYEVSEAIDDGDPQELCAELGDLGLQIVFHAALARRAGEFNVDDVYEGICAKLIRRHPHVFGDVSAEDAATVLKNWEAIKHAERTEKSNGDKPPSALEGVPKALPGLQRAQRLQAKAARVGFDWAEIGPVLDKIKEEFEELEHEIRPKADAIVAPVKDARAEAPLPVNQDKIAEELGDLLFALVNLARFLHVDPEQAIQNTNRKFLRRFQHVEKRLHERGKVPAESSLEEMDLYWEEAKRGER